MATTVTLDLKVVGDYVFSSTNKEPTPVSRVPEGSSYPYGSSQIDLDEGTIVYSVYDISETPYAFGNIPVTLTDITWYAPGYWNGSMTYTHSVKFIATGTLLTYDEILELSENVGDIITNRYQSQLSRVDYSFIVDPLSVKEGRYYLYRIPVEVFPDALILAELNSNAAMKMEYLTYTVSFEGNAQNSGVVSNMLDSLESDNTGSITIPNTIPSHTDTVNTKNITVTGKGNGGVDISSSGSIITTYSYTHEGWKFGDSLYIIGDKFYPTNDCTLLASWEQSVSNTEKNLPSIGTTTRDSTSGTSKVILDSNGGIATTEEITGEYTTSYELKEWNTVAAGIGFSYPVGTEFEDSITLYAIWNPRTDYEDILLPSDRKLSYEHVGWSNISNDLYPRFKGRINFSEIKDITTLYAIYNLPEINYSLYLGAQKMSKAYLGTKELKFCIPQYVDRLGYDEYHLIIPSVDNYPEITVIKVNTETPVTSYSISAEEPKNPEEGMIWIIPNPYNNPLNPAITIDGVATYPQSCKQYVSGIWEDRCVGTIIDGEYVEWWDGYIFRNGVGLSDKFSYTSRIEGSGSWDIRISEEYMYMLTHDLSTRHLLFTPPIDTAKSTMLNIRYTYYGYTDAKYNTKVIFKSAYNTGPTDYLKFSETFNNTEEPLVMSIPINDISGLAYVGINSGAGYDGKIHIYDLWVE